MIVISDLMAIIGDQAMSDPHTSAKKLQLLLNAVSQTPSGLNSTRGALEALGIPGATGGAATMSVRVTDDQFDRYFAPYRSPGTDLTIPAELSDYVASITEAPDHLHFASGRGKDDEGL